MRVRTSIESPVRCYRLVGGVYPLNVLYRVIQILATKEFGCRPMIIVSVTLYVIWSAVSGAAHKVLSRTKGTELEHVLSKLW